MKLPWSKKDKPGWLSSEMHAQAGVLGFAFAKWPSKDAPEWEWVGYVITVLILAALAGVYGWFRTTLKRKDERQGD